MYHAPHTQLWYLYATLGVFEMAYNDQSLVIKFLIVKLEMCLILCFHFFIECTFSELFLLLSKRD